MAESATLENARKLTKLTDVTARIGGSLGVEEITGEDTVAPRGERPHEVASDETTPTSYENLFGFHETPLRGVGLSNRAHRSRAI